MREVSDPLPSVRVRRSLVIRHFVLSAFLWITYVVYWRVVLSRGIEHEARLAGVLLGLFVTLQVLLTASWIAHNRRLARRRGGRRRARPPAPPAAPRDFLGRTLRAYPADADLTRVPVVLVRVEGEEKRFEAGLALPEEGRGGA